MNVEAESNDRATPARATTQDVVSRSRATDGGTRPPLRPVIEILFHPDLSRVGEIAANDPFIDPESHGIVDIGREATLFRPVDVNRPRLLEDPCISAHHVQAEWIGSKSAFRIWPHSAGGPPVRIMNRFGVEYEPRELVPAGTIVAIHERILLLFTARSLSSKSRFGMEGESQASWDLRRAIKSVARTTDDVRIEGETGVGKELVARAIHAASKRKDGPYQPYSCACTPTELADTTLFGHIKGAFFGADKDRIGLFEKTNGGTLMLDEIQAMPIAHQVKLLRAVQEKEICRVGDNKERSVDSRVVVVSSASLVDEVSAGRFLQELLGRFEAPYIKVPTLDERWEDIPRLFVHFLRKFFTENLNESHESAAHNFFDPVTTKRSIVRMSLFLDLIAHKWPRNIRQLDKFARTVGRTLEPPARFQPSEGVGTSNISNQVPTPKTAKEPETPIKKGTKLEKPTREALKKPLREHAYSKSKVAREIGCAWNTVDAWMREHDIRSARDYSLQEIEKAMVEANHDVKVAAEEILWVSERALMIRMKTLDYPIVVRGSRRSGAAGQ